MRLTSFGGSFILLFMPEWSLYESLLWLLGTVFMPYVSWKLFMKIAPQGCWGNPGVQYYQKNWVAVCGLLSKTLTLFQSKICNFPQSIYDLTKILRPYLRPKWPKLMPISDQNSSKHHTIWGCTYLYSPYKGAPRQVGELRGSLVATSGMIFVKYVVILKVHLWS